MSRALARQMGAVRTALLAGDPQAALNGIDDLTRIALKHGVDADARHDLEPALVDLRALALASLTGAQQAAEQVRAIVQAARSLQTYDSLGHRQVTATLAAAPQRF